MHWPKKKCKTHSKTLRSSHFIIFTRFFFQKFDIHVTYEIFFLYRCKQTCQVTWTSRVSPAC